MKIQSVLANRRLEAFEVQTPRGHYTYPFAKVGLVRETPRVAEVYVDEELGYRLLDPTNSAKSVGQMLALLHLVGREIDVVVNPTPASSAP